LQPLNPAESLTFDYYRQYDRVVGQRPLMMVNFRNIDPTTRRLIGAARVLVMVDSGADVTMLPETVALGLGVRTSTLPIYPMSGIGGVSACRGEQTLLAELCGSWVPVPVVFFPVGGHLPLLGRKGAFHAMKVAFIHSANRMLATSV
jgi:hypothetical protein